MKKSVFFQLNDGARCLIMVAEINEEDSSMNDTFNIDDMALITGLSTRTIRSYIADGFLDGDKSSGAWRFTAEQVYAFLQNKAVQPALRCKKNAIVSDFMGAPHKEQDMMCVVLDLPSDQAGCATLLLCKYMCALETKTELRFASDRLGKTLRIILSGNDADVMALLTRYYKGR